MAKEQWVQNMMTASPQTVEQNDTVLRADQLLTELRIRHLPVVNEDGQLCGIVTRHDIFRTAIARAFGFGSTAQDKLMATILVKEVMTADPKFVAPDMALPEAAEILMSAKIGGLPVVDGTGNIVGILTESDFVRGYLEG